MGFTAAGMMKMAGAAVAAMNAVDAACTSYFLESGMATEANPVMCAAYSVSPSFFAASKMMMACAGAAVLVRYGDRPAARYGMAAAMAAYAAVCCYHAAFAFFGS
jgi:hypothetical protein